MCNKDLTWQVRFDRAYNEGMAKALYLIPVALLAAVLVWFLVQRQTEALPEREGVPVGGKIVKTDDEWRKQLTEEQFQVTRRKCTERAFTGAYWNTKQDGVYVCVCCGQPLYDAATKFDSGTGWPSFWQPVA